MSVLQYVCLFVCVDSFSVTWTGDKDRFIIRFRDTNPSVADFDATFTRFGELSNKAQAVDAICNLEFVMLDCSPLKCSILTHIDDLLTRLQALLLKMASQKLTYLCTFMSENSKQ